ncbi:MAG: ATP-binding protein, partial [Tissierellaceae bacterium]
MSGIETLESMLRTLKMYHTAENIDIIIERSRGKSLSNERFLEEFLSEEIKGRESRRLEKRLKQALFPEYKTLLEFNLDEQRSLSKKQLNQLKELIWLEQGYNIILLGPPGVGKTHLSIGIGIEAINNGYKVRFTTMADLVHLLKTQEISTVSRNKVNRIIDSDLFIIDDLMFMAMEKQEANLFFQLITK